MTRASSCFSYQATNTFYPKRFERPFPTPPSPRGEKRTTPATKATNFGFYLIRTWDSATERFRRKEVEKQFRSLARAWLLFQNSWQTVVKEARTDRLHQRKVLQPVQYLRETFGLSKS